jgi:hypothetical protein
VTRATRRDKEKDPKKKRGQIEHTAKKRRWMGKSTDVEAKKESEAMRTLNGELWDAATWYSVEKSAGAGDS